jgi:hypothetical protein
MVRTCGISDDTSGGTGAGAAASADAAAGAGAAVDAGAGAGGSCLNIWNHEGRCCNCSGTGICVNRLRNCPIGRVNRDISYYSLVGSIDGDTRISSNYSRGGWLCNVCDNCGVCGLIYRLDSSIIRYGNNWQGQYWQGRCWVCSGRISSKSRGCFCLKKLIGVFVCLILSQLGFQVMSLSLVAVDCD